MSGNTPWPRSPGRCILGHRTASLAEFASSRKRGAGSEPGSIALPYEKNSNPSALPPTRASGSTAVSDPFSGVAFTAEGSRPHVVALEEPIRLGAVTREQVRARTRELALLAGRVPPHVLQTDYEEAKRELTGTWDLERQEAILDAGQRTGGHFSGGNWRVAAT